MEHNKPPTWTMPTVSSRIELLSAAQREAIVGPCMREWLTPLGLIEVVPRKWVDSSHPPVRRLFELQLLKGAGIKACWGFSLDFVPHIGAGRIYWHRTDKKAIFDVMVDPQELPQASYIRGEERLRADLTTLMPLAVAGAQRDWKRAASYTGMIELIREIRTKRTNCFCQYTQLPLAYAFLAAKVGDMQLAEQELSDYLAREDLDQEEKARLERLLRECAAKA